MATSKTASSPPNSRNFSLKLPPVFLTVPEVSEHMQAKRRPSTKGKRDLRRQCYKKHIHLIKMSVDLPSYEKNIQFPFLVWELRRYITHT